MTEETTTTTTETPKRGRPAKVAATAMTMTTSATPAAEPTPKATLEQLFKDPRAVEIKRALMHQAFQVPGAGTESTLNASRTRGLEMVYHPGYGLIGCLKGKYFLAPHANVIVAHESVV